MCIQRRTLYMYICIYTYKNKNIYTNTHAHARTHTHTHTAEEQEAEEEPSATHAAAAWASGADTSVTDLIDHLKTPPLQAEWASGRAWRHVGAQLPEGARLLHHAALQVALSSRSCFSQVRGGRVGGRGGQAAAGGERAGGCVCALG